MARTAHAPDPSPAVDLLADVASAALKAWSEQGDASLADHLGRVWSVVVDRAPEGIALLLRATAFGDEDGPRHAETRVSQAHLGADDLRDAAIAAAVAHVATALTPR